MVLVGVITTVILLEGRRGPDWQVELSEYIIQHRLPDGTIKVGEAVKANKPENFQQSMGLAIPNGWPWGIEEVPFPPSAMKRVLLEQSRNTGAETQSRRQVIFVGYHSDSLWRMGWLVHEGPIEPFTQEHITTITAIGCDLGLELE